MVVLTEKFRFIRDDVFLCPWVDTATGKQKLIMQKINLETDEVEFEDSIDCIHAAITDISRNEFNEFQIDSETQEKLLKKTLFIRSSENLREINLIPEEKFKALKSWAAGIAELGMNALQVQSEIEYSANFAYPMIGILFRFMTKVDSKFITQYLSKIERECKFEGVNHKSSLIANLLPILWSISLPLPEEDEWEIEPKDWKMEPEEREIMSAIIAIDPPHELFEKNPSLIYLLKDFPDYFNKLNIEPLEDFFYSHARHFEILAENRPELIINRLKSEDQTESINIKKCLDLIFQSFSEKDFGAGQKQILLYILESKFDLTDSMDSFRYYYLSYMNPSLTKKLLDESQKKNTKKGILDQDSFSQSIEKIMEWISSKYEDDFKYLEYFEEHEMQIIYLYLSHPPSLSKSSLKKFSPLPEIFLRFIFKDFNENKEKIISLLISGSLYLFNNISEHILENDLLLDLAKLYFSKVNELYKHNEEMLVEKYSQFLKLLIDESKYRPSFGRFEGYKHTIYDNKQDVYYYCDYREIINLLLEFRPPPKLFNQNRLFLKFLLLPEALEIQKYNEFIKSLKNLPVFTKMGESEKTNWELRNAILTGDHSKRASILSKWAIDYYLDGEYGQALSYYKEVLYINNEMGNIPGKIDALNMIGATYCETRKHDQAVRIYSKMLKMADSLDDPPLKASTLINVGDGYHRMKEHLKALEIYDKALKITDLIDDLPLKASTLKDIGDKYSRMGQHHKLAGDKWVEPYIEPSSVNYSEMEQYHKALEIYKKAFGIEDQLGNLPRKANLLHLIGSAYSEIGENDIALETYREGLKIETKLDNISNKIYFLRSIGLLYNKIGDNTLAIEKFKEGIKLADKMDDFRAKKRIMGMLESDFSMN